MNQPSVTLLQQLASYKTYIIVNHDDKFFRGAAGSHTVNDPTHQKYKWYWTDNPHGARHYTTIKGSNAQMRTIHKYCPNEPIPNIIECNLNFNQVIK